MAIVNMHCTDVSIVKKEDVVIDVDVVSNDTNVSTNIVDVEIDDTTTTLKSGFIVNVEEYLEYLKVGEQISEDEYFNKICVYNDNIPIKEDSVIFTLDDKDNDNTKTNEQEGLVWYYNKLTHSKYENIIRNLIYTTHPKIDNIKSFIIEYNENYKDRNLYSSVVSLLMNIKNQILQ